MDQEQEKLWDRITELENEVTHLKDFKVANLENQMKQLDDMILSNPGFQRKEEKGEVL